MAEDTKTTQQIKVRYTDTSALYASQFILNSSDEDITINFSSGPMVDPSSGETMLPVHTRIALTKSAAQRLMGVLGKALAGQDAQANSADATQMQMPKLKQ